MKKDNLIQNKSFDFALRMIKLSKFLSGKNERIIANQILRSGLQLEPILKKLLELNLIRIFLQRLQYLIKKQEKLIIG